MLSNLLLYIGSAISVVWGVAHLVPTKSVIAGFGAISLDNRRIITMEWVGEGLTLIFIGLLVLSVAGLGESGSSTAAVVYRGSSVMLLFMAGLSLLTGARTSILPMRLCPFIKTTAAILILVGSMI